jgi:hypothetical protein
MCLCTAIPIGFLKIGQTPRPGHDCFRRDNKQSKAYLEVVLSVLYGICVVYGIYVSYACTCVYM